MGQQNSHSCLVCDRIKQIQQGKNPYFIKEMETGYAVLGDCQYFRGYCLFLCKFHKTELHELKKDIRLKFLEEMALVAESVYKTFNPRKLNYELLGNTDEHMHWHIFPRYKNDLMPDRVVWAVDKTIRNNEKYILTEKQRNLLIAKISLNLNKIIEG